MLEKFPIKFRQLTPGAKFVNKLCAAMKTSKANIFQKNKRNFNNNNKENICLPTS